ncbi:MAG: type V CRISPR-associated protein Cas12a/Cpf1 [Paludibacter sp.]|nr:type V CRISPR-associated protein Cas12a/Cpf1 [Paludibacter sp.]
MKNLTDFTGLYPLSKTLRFELIPQGKTLEYVVSNGLLEKDEHRAESYVLVKRIIDEYHKFFIAGALDNFKLDSLEEYYLYYQIIKRNDDEKKKFEDIQLKLRKQIAEQFTKSEGYKNLFAKELIKEDLKTFVQTIEDRQLIEEFQNFTTYFTGFHENRKNMYSAEDKSTAIAFRIIHQNLPKFLDNMRVFEKIAVSPINEKFPKLLTDLAHILQVENIEDMFNLNYFNETLTQRGIDVYNHLLSGYADEGKVKIQGLNEYINEFNQPLQKNQRIGKLKPLFKQILSDRSTASFIPEEFDNDNEVLESIEKLYQEINAYALPQLIVLLQNLKEYDVHKIYLRNDLGFTDISQKMFGDWGVFQKAVAKWFDINYKGKAKQGTEKFEDEQKKYFSSQDSYTIGFINDSLALLENPIYHLKVEDYLRLLGEPKGEGEKLNNLFKQVELNYLMVQDLLNNPYSTEKNLAQDQRQVDKLKLLLDSIKSLQWYVKPLLGKGNESDKDERFYGEFSGLWDTLDQITPLYNKVRNYMTRKPYSTEKMKLNFENSTLLDGWDVNKEEANASILFEKNGCYYLGIMDKNHNKIFRKIPTSKTNDTYQKINYKLLPGASKMLPKVFFSNSNIGYYNPTDEILSIRNHGSHTKNGKPQDGFEKKNFSIDDCKRMIDFFKKSIDKHEDWKNFGFIFSDTNSYQSIDEFYREVEGQGYSITYTNIDAEYINQMVDEGKLYLFQIYNKDFSPYSKGTPNMHTLYWKMLFDPQNLNDVVYKLNGQAEVFYRKSSIKDENMIIHRNQYKIAKKTYINQDREAVRIEEKVVASLNSYYQGKLSKDQLSKDELKYIDNYSDFKEKNIDITKDKRYTVDKFQFHVPITMNFKAPSLNNINTEVNNYLKTSQNQHVIGIDRGERHLLYLTLIDGEGRIVKQFSLNEIVNEYQGNIYKTNYHTLLDKKEGNRDEARKNWKTIETIKELKEGYLSQVIHKISELMVEYNAIVVLEDLNMGFMRGRQKVEKQVYQKFEKMLIDKLNYLVDKKKTSAEAGGTLHALQFTNKFESFQKMGKQSGFLFYVPAWNTSKMDPVTGFVNLFDTRYENMEKAKAFFNKFDTIHYNKANNRFEFAFDYNRFTTKAEGTKTNWTLCTNSDRIETFRNPDKNNKWDNREINITDEFHKLFASVASIETQNFASLPNEPNAIKQLILKQTEKSFFERLFYLLKLTLQMRNSKTDTEIDYLISPVANEKGQFYDSRNGIESLPTDADANGAYNIARKGLWAIEQIRKTDDLKKLKLAITNKEWLAFVQR